MRRHHLPHQVVRDVAVEHGAQKRLVVARKQRLQAEKGMRRDHSRWKDRGDEREAIRGAGDIAVGKAGSRERRSSVEQARRAALGDSLRGAIDQRAKRLDVLAFDHRKARCGLRENGRDRRSRSARGRTARSTRRRRRAGECCARRVRGCARRFPCAAPGSASVCPLSASRKDGVSTMGCGFDARPVAGVRNGLELGRVGDAETAGDLPGRVADGRRADEEAHTSVNRKDGAPIVEAADGVDAGSGEQEHAPKRGRGVVGREARRQHEADSAASPGQA